VVLAVLLAVTGCSGAGTDGSALPSGAASASDTDPAPTDAPTPTGTEAIFDIEATLHPGAASGSTVPTRVDVSLTNIGTVAGSMSGTVTLTDEAGTEFTAVAGKPAVLDFGTLQPGAEVVRSYTVALPAAAAITSVTVEPENGIPVDGPAAMAA
jgi:hypothetical protein